MLIFEELLKEMFPLQNMERVENKYELTFAEENTTRYVGGYIISVLQKCETNKQLLTGMNMLVDANPQLDCADSNAWVNEVNCGGLTKITNEGYGVFTAIEASIRSYLQLSKAHNLDSSTRAEISKCVFANDDVQFNWCKTGVTATVGDGHSEELVEMFINKWRTIRGFSFASSVQELMKQENQKKYIKN